MRPKNPIDAAVHDLQLQLDCVRFARERTERRAKAKYEEASRLNPDIARALYNEEALTPGQVKRRQKMEAIRYSAAARVKAYMAEAAGIIAKMDALKRERAAESPLFG